ncbi:MAG: neutral zinc metallopeptidase, partial [Pseudomonadota bacterium]
MVRWEGRRQSDNVDDLRGPGGAGLNIGLVALVLRFVLGRFGIGGVIVLVGGYFALSAIGVNPLALGGAGGGSGRTTPQDDAAAAFSKTMLAETEDAWTRIFAANGSRYPAPRLNLYNGQVNSACGFATAAAGPFYCPADKEVYLDHSFLREFWQPIGA